MGLDLVEGGLHGPAFRIEPRQLERWSDVLLTFTPATDVTMETTLTHGSGVMTVKDGKVAMLNQMSSGPSTLQVSHCMQNAS